MEKANLVATLAALAHEHRLHIIRLLAKERGSGMPAGEIADRVGISVTNASFHLKEMHRAGLVRSTREGRFIRYAANADGMDQLLAYLKEQCFQQKRVEVVPRPSRPYSSRRKATR